MISRLVLIVQLSVDICVIYSVCNIYTYTHTHTFTHTHTHTHTYIYTHKDKGTQVVWNNYSEKQIIGIKGRIRSGGFPRIFTVAFLLFLATKGPIS